MQLFKPLLLYTMLLKAMLANNNGKYLFRIWTWKAAVTMYTLLFLTSVFLTICTNNECNGIALNQVNYDVTNYPFDKELYEDVLNPELCERQLNFLKANNTALLLRFFDASARFPRGIFLANTKDLGNYKQCLNIHEYVEDANIQGKYCMTRVLFNQSMLTRSRFLESPKINQVEYDKDIFNRILIYEHLEKRLQPSFGFQIHDTRVGTGSPSSSTNFRLAICIPQSCTSHETINAIFSNITDPGVNLEEQFCRLPNDKPWVPSDYVAIVIFSIILLLTILSTCYDIWYSVILKKDFKEINKLYCCFSVYTNTRRLVTFKPGSETLHCIDGIRTLAMMWVVVGHTFLLVLFSLNLLEAFQWATSTRAMWLTAAPITVDTFFMLSGLLVVYSTSGKLNSKQLLKNIHLFYLNRLLRMFPILAAVILYKVSFHNRLFDGPNWNESVALILACRQYWWSALLHIQNLYNPKSICLPVSWYLSVDVQLHLLSPLILVWVLSEKKKIAWTALAVGLTTSLVAATIYNFINDFISGSFSTNVLEVQRYQMYYYYNTLTRASPFLVGMIFGYMLHLWKGKHLRIPKVIVLVLWACTLFLFALVIYCVPLNIHRDWNNQLVDNILNSFMRPAWALGLGWLIFACAKGYGGPVNWFLSLNIWKLPARLSYAVYLIHFTLIVATNFSSNVQSYFTVSNLIYDAAAFLFITTIIAFVVTVTIDAPFTTIIKLLLTADKRKTKSVSINNIRVENNK